MQTIANDIPVYKIGISASPKTRLVSVSTGCPFPVKIVHMTELLSNAATIERILHHMLSEHHSNGEWYSCSLDDILSSITKLKSSHMKVVAKEISRSSWVPDLSSFSEEEMENIVTKKRKIHACKRSFIPRGIPWPPPKKWKSKLVYAMTCHLRQAKNNINFQP